MWGVWRESFMEEPISLPEEIFPVKGHFGLNSKRESLNPASILTESSTANLFSGPLIAAATPLYLDPYVTAILR